MFNWNFVTFAFCSSALLTAQRCMLVAHSVAGSSFCALTSHVSRDLNVCWKLAEPRWQRADHPLKILTSLPTPSWVSVGDNLDCRGGVFWRTDYSSQQTSATRHFEIMERERLWEGKEMERKEKIFWCDCLPSYAPPTSSCLISFSPFFSKLTPTKRKKWYNAPPFWHKPLKSLRLK